MSFLLPFPRYSAWACPAEVGVSHRMFSHFPLQHLLRPENQTVEAA